MLDVTDPDHELAAPTADETIDAYLRGKEGAVWLDAIPERFRVHENFTLFPGTGALAPVRAAWERGRAAFHEIDDLVHSYYPGWTRP